MAYCNAKLLSWFASLPLLNVAITEFWCLSFIHIRLHSAVLFSLSMYSGLTTFDDALLGRGYFLDSLMNMKLYSLSLREDELGMVFDISKNNFSIWLHFVIKNLPMFEYCEHWYSTRILPTSINLVVVAQRSIMVQMWIIVNGFVLFFECYH